MTIIFTYTREMAIADGVLIDVTETARDAGFRCPVALTHGCWETCVRVPEGAGPDQDERGRLWDVLVVLFYAIRRARTDGTWLAFVVAVDDGQGPEEVQLKAHCGPGDHGEMVLTVMLPDED